MPDLNPDQQQILADRLRRAKSGEPNFAWLHKLVLDAGYAPVLGEKPDDKVLVTARALAAGYSISVRQIRVWIQEGLPTHRHAVGNRPALFDVWDVQRWHKDRALAAGEPDRVQKGHRVSATKEMYTAEQVRKLKRENEEAEGSLVRAEDIASQLRVVGLGMRRRFEHIERKHGPIVGKAIRKTIDDAQDKWERIVAPGPGVAQKRVIPKRKVKKKVKKAVKKRVVKKKVVKKRKSK